jgi:electron-transferring-flavoprotein dehydrogenase
LQRETLEFDFVIVGGGPAGLSTACRLGQLGAERGLEQSVCVLEKGSEIGAHVMSGAVLEPRALTELFPDWQSRRAPVSVEVAHESLHWLAGGQRSLRVPNALLPLPMRNEGNYIVSLGRLCRWMAEQAETLGVDIFPG